MTCETCHCAGERQCRPHHPLRAEDDQRYGEADQGGHLPNRLLGVRKRRDGAVACSRLRRVGVEAATPKQDHVGDRDQEKGHRRDPGWDQVEDQETGDRGGEQRDGALDSQRPPGQVDCAGQHCAGADHRGQVEDVRAENHSHAHPFLARRESDQGGGELRAVCGQRREQADEGLGEPEPGPNMVEPVGEQRRRRERDGDGEGEQRYCQGGADG